MKTIRPVVRNIAAVIAAAFCITSCGGGATSTGALPLSAMAVSPDGGISGKYIKHVVVVIQENRSFDNFFSTFPGADGTKGGCMKPYTSRARVLVHRYSGSCPSGDKYVLLKESNLIEPCDWGHGYTNFKADYDGGYMDGFGLEGKGQSCHGGPAGKLVYQYVNPKQLAPDWTIAQQYVLADHMFQTQGSGSFTAHQDLIAGGTIINAARTKSLVDFPTKMPWGCDAAPGTKTSLVFYSMGEVHGEPGQGPFPCMTYATLRDRLDAKKVSWKYYSPPEPYGTGALWNAFDAIEKVRCQTFTASDDDCDGYGPEWKTNIANTNVFFTDVSGGTLPSVSWIVPDDNNSDHPANHDDGPSWVASIVNAIGQSSYWDSTAIIIVWDDWGGFYDHVAPTLSDHWGGLGFRVPMLVVSAYARETSASQPGYISHTQYEFGSILKFIENDWSLNSLNTTDKRATSIVDCFDFTQQPRQFSVIPSTHGIEYFLHQPPSYLPVDSE